MPVIAVPKVQPPPLPTCPPVTNGCCGQQPPCDNTKLPVTGCHGLRVITAPLDSVMGRPLLTRLRSVTLAQGQVADVEWTFTDEHSRPIDLGDCTHDLSQSLGSIGPHDTDTAGDFRFVFRIREQLTDCHAVKLLPVTVLDPANGKVAIHFTEGDTVLPGIFFGELSLEQAEADHPSLHSNIFYVIIQRNAQGVLNSVAGPPSLAEVRLYLRDSDPAENFLLDNIQFSDVEIAFAIVKPIEYWNEVPPPLQQHATTSNFPSRFHWLLGTTSVLFDIAANQYRSNNLTYSAAGVSVDDQNKEPNYQRAADARWEKYTTWVRQKKISINVNACYGEIGSPYSRLW